MPATICCVIAMSACDGVGSSRVNRKNNRYAAANTAFRTACGNAIERKSVFG
jgi:hypothetical protein